MEVNLARGLGMVREKSMETRKIVSITADMAEAISNFRFENRISSESEAIRRLIEMGLAAAKTKPA